MCTSSSLHCSIIEYWLEDNNGGQQWLRIISRVSCDQAEQLVREVPHISCLASHHITEQRKQMNPVWQNFVRTEHRISIRSLRQPLTSSKLKPSKTERQLHTWKQPLTAHKYCYFVTDWSSSFVSLFEPVRPSLQSKLLEYTTSKRESWTYKNTTNGFDYYLPNT